MSSQPPDWSLKKEIRKRQTQQLIRVAEARRTQTSLPVVPPTPAASTPPLLTQTAPTVAPTPTKRRISLPRVVSRRWLLLGGLALAVWLCLASALMVSNQSAPSTPAFLPLPTSSAQEALAYLQQSGVSVSAQQTFSVPNDNWQARQMVQFEAQHGTEQGLFLLLSYDTANQAGLDGFRASSGGRFKTWRVDQFTNLLLLSSPDAAADLSSEIAGRLTEHFIAPYRPFLPTATVS